MKRFPGERGGENAEAIYRVRGMTFFPHGHSCRLRARERMFMILDKCLPFYKLARAKRT